VEHETQSNRSVEVNEAPTVKRLDGDVTRVEEVSIAGGLYCEVWEGRWERGSGEGISREKVGDKGVRGEKVSLSPTASILLIWLFVGGLESTPSTQVTREGTQGSTFAD